MHYSLFLLSTLTFLPLTLAYPPQTPFLPIQGDPTECPSGKQWYVCFKNKFRGCCSVDPCDLPACPDSSSPPPPPPPTDPTQCPSGKQWYVCFKNKFRGCCTVDPCDLPNCPDTTLPSGKLHNCLDTALQFGDPTQCPSGKQWYVCFKNKFRGCCAVDPCDLPGCPDTTPPPPPPTDPTQCSSGKQWYVCAKNKFRGCCSVDPCDLPGCPDATLSRTRR